MAFVFSAPELCSEEEDKAEYSEACVSLLCAIFIPETKVSDLHQGCLRKVNGGIFHFYSKEISWIFFFWKH